MELGCNNGYGYEYYRGGPQAAPCQGFIDWIAWSHQNLLVSAAGLRMIHSFLIFALGIIPESFRIFYICGKHSWSAQDILICQMFWSYCSNKISKSQKHWIVFTGRIAMVASFPKRICGMWPATPIIPNWNSALNCLNLQLSLYLYLWLATAPPTRMLSLPQLGWNNLPLALPALLGRLLLSPIHPRHFQSS